MSGFRRYCDDEAYRAVVTTQRRDGSVQVHRIGPYSTKAPAKGSITSIKRLGYYGEVIDSYVERATGWERVDD